MKIQTVMEKLRDIFGRTATGGSGKSVLSQKISRQGYQARHSGSVARKKGFKDKWLALRRGLKQAGTRSNQSLEEGGGKKKLYRAGTLVVVLIVGFVLFTGPLQSVLDKAQTFRIHEVDISGCVMTNSKELRKFADISYELNMLTLDPRLIQKKLLQHPWIVEAEVRRIWPDRLAVAVKEYRPTALVALDGEDGPILRYMDRKGSVFAKVQAGQEIDFPVITGFDESATEVERKEMLAAVTLFLRLASRNNPNLPAQNVSEIHFASDGDLVLYLVEQPFPIFFGKGEIRRKFSQLREVLEDLYRKKRGKAMIDEVAYIRMDYLENKVLVAKKKAGKRHG